jgi:hypothetical protein
MAIELVDVGAEPNDATGDPLRTAFQKINNNFVYMQESASNIADAVTLDDTPDQVIFEYSANTFTQGMFQIKSYNEDNNDSQDVMLQAQLSNDGNTIKFTGYGGSFFGNNVCTYDMIVNSGNVQITVSPLDNVVLNHFISYQITWTGSLGVGSPMASQTQGDLITEYGNAFITTEG